MSVPEHLFDSIPLWGLFFATVVLVLLALQVGVLLGQRRRKEAEHEHEGAVGAVVTYHELRTGKEGADFRELAKAFD